MIPTKPKPIWPFVLWLICAAVIVGLWIGKLA